MALGGRTFLEGDAYASMGSSSWITVSSSEPLLDDRVRPFVFAHVAPGMFISATSIFSSGTSVNWVTDTLLPDVKQAAKAAGLDVHDELFRLAGEAPAGARGLIFVPTLGGGTSFEGGPAVRGGFIGLDLQHGRADIMRAALEGVALGLPRRARRIASHDRHRLGDDHRGRRRAQRLLAAGLFRCLRLHDCEDEDRPAGRGPRRRSLGFRRMGLWTDFLPIRALHVAEGRSEPAAETRAVYQAALVAYRQAAEQQQVLSGALAALREVAP